MKTNLWLAVLAFLVSTPFAAAQAVPDAGPDQTIGFPGSAVLAGQVSNVSPLDWWTADGNLATENKIVKCDATGIASSVGPLFNHNNPTEIFGWPSDLVYVGSTVYGIESLKRYLYTVDPNTGECFPIGAANTWQDVYCLAYDAAGDRLFGVDLLKKRVLRFNRTTGAVTALPTSISGWQLVRALAYDDTSGWLYAIDQNTNKMIRIDPATGAATFFKQMTIDPTFRIEELHFWHGKMYASKGFLDAGGSLIGHRLSLVDMNAGTYSDIGPYIPDVSPHSLVINSLPESSSWSQESGPGVATFANPASPTTSVSFSVAGTYVLRLTVDNWPTPAFDTVTIAVGVDQCPDDPNKTEPGVCGCGVPDTDGDGDGTPDCNDGCPSDPAKLDPGVCGCGVADTDSDGDGTADCLDLCPNDPAKLDPGACGCGVADTDSDGDGTADCLDLCPNDPAKLDPGACGCGVADTDSDGDGTADCLDLCPNDPAKLDPGACGCGVADTDSDGDGTADCLDLCPNDPAKLDPGACGCGVADTDSDGDGTADCLDLCPNDPAKLDPGACGCGVADTDGDGDGTADCLDLCPNDPGKTAPGLCGCGVADADGDTDGVIDCFDNCPALANTDQADGDFDGVGDVCDNCATLANPTQSDCDQNGIGDACEIAAGALDCDANGVPDACELAAHDCNQNGIVDACDITSGTSFDLNANQIPDECELPSGTPFCFGDGTGVACPCGNVGGPGEGCANSRGTGAKLSNLGGTSVSTDDVLLDVVNLPTNKNALIFLGTSTFGGGNGAPFGDGLLCVQPKFRFPVQQTGTIGAFQVAQPASVTPTWMVAGTTRYFQAWFRDPTGPCGATYNFSNGLAVTLTP